MAEIGPDFRGGYYGEQTEPSGGGWDPNSEGPLAKLYGSSEYDFNSRFYPRDLGTDKRGHYINFYINVTNNSTYIEKNKYKFVTGNAGRTAANEQKEPGVTSASVNSVINAGINTTNKLLSNENKIDQVEWGKDISLAKKTKRITEAISLYMPETMNVQYNSNWESTSLTDAGGLPLGLAQVGGGLLDSLDFKNLNQSIRNIASNGLTQSGAAEAIGSLADSSSLGFQNSKDFLLKAVGTALNPQLQALFKGVDFRTFQFEFLFAPYSSQESKNVIEIVNTFKFHMAPELVENSYGRYFIPPSEFDIDFLFGGQVNDKVHKVGTCVLQNVNVDYAPNGWSTFEDGMPTHIRLTLQFMETEIVTKRRIKEGY